MDSRGAAGCPWGWNGCWWTPGDPLGAAPDGWMDPLLDNVFVLSVL